MQQTGTEAKSTWCDRNCAGADVNANPILQRSFLNAARTGNIELMKGFLKSGISVNITNDDGNSALMLASYHGHELCVNALLEARADVNITNIVDNSAHHMAAGIEPLLFRMGLDEFHAMGSNRQIESNAKCVESLINAGADVNLPGKNGKTALINAVSFDQAKTAEILINAGADVNGQNDDGETALTKASGFGYHNCVSLLLTSGANVNLPNHRGLAALFRATNGGHSSCVKLLLEAGADVNYRMFLGETALHVTTNLACTVMLLGAGAHVNRLNDFGSNALSMYLTPRSTVSVKPTVALTLFAAGERISDSMTRPQHDIPALNAHSLSPAFIARILQQPAAPSDKNLMFICRDAIRNHLLELDRHTHLFARVPRLGLPGTLQSYLLYNMSLDIEKENEPSKI